MSDKDLNGSKFDLLPEHEIDTAFLAREAGSSKNGIEDDIRYFEKRFMRAFGVNKKMLSECGSLHIRMEQLNKMYGRSVVLDCLRYFQRKQLLEKVKIK